MILIRTIIRIVLTGARISYSNNTEINNTDISDNNPILSGRDVDKDERSDYREYLIEQLDMAVLYERYPYDRETLDSILDMLSDVGHGEYMGKTDYLMMINGNKILKFGTGECFIGSALIMKYDGKGLGFLSGDEFDEAAKEFESRKVCLIDSDPQGSLTQSLGYRIPASAEEWRVLPGSCGRKERKIRIRTDD